MFKRVCTSIALATSMLAPAWGMRPLYDITEAQARDDLSRGAVMVLSYVAQAARGVGQPMVPQREIDQASTITERFMRRWRGEQVRPSPGASSWPTWLRSPRACRPRHASSTCAPTAIALRWHWRPAGRAG